MTGVITWLRGILQLRTRAKKLVTFLGILPRQVLGGAPSVNMADDSNVDWVRHPHPPQYVDLSHWHHKLPDRTNNKEIHVITADEYNSAEAKALRTLSIPSLMAFQPATFQSVGFPTNVFSDDELVRYADHNFEAEVPKMYLPDAEFTPIGFVNAFTPSEAALAKCLRDIVADMTRDQFGRPVKPMTNLMVQFGPYRCMESLSKVFGRKLAVFEPGPGAGYLGALLALNGYTYASFDVTQSLYLWQSHLLNAVTGGAFNELVRPENQSYVNRMSVMHMPWWLFAHQNESTPLRYDVIYSNSNLGEMTKVSFHQLLNFSRIALRDSEVAIFTFFSTGMTRFNSLETIDADLAEFGFYRIMSEPFHCYQLTGRDPSLVRKAFAHGIPHIGEDDEEPNLEANTVFSTRRSEAPLDIELTQLFHKWKAPLTD